MANPVTPLLSPLLSLGLAVIETPLPGLAEPTVKVALGTNLTWSTHAALLPPLPPLFRSNRQRSLCKPAGISMD